MTLRSLRCSSCHAPLTIDDDRARTFTCSFCNVVNQLDAPPLPGPQRTPRPANPGSGLAAAVVVALTAGVVAAVVFIGRSRSSTPAPAPRVVSATPVALPRPPVLPTGKPKPAIPQGPADLFWLDQYIAPVPVDANGDGVEDLAGAFVIPERGSLNAYVGVVDGKTWTLLWKAGPYGNREKAMRSTGVAVRGDRLLAVNALGDAKIHVVASGEVLATFPFEERDPARWICALGDSGPVYLGTTWGGGQVVDLATLAHRKSSVPQGCGGDRRRAADTGDVSARRAFNETRAAPKLERFEARAWYHDGTHGVMLGSALGADTVQLVGFDPRKHVETWRTPLAALAPLADGQKPDPVELAEGLFFLTYGDDRERHLLAVDVATGEKRWDAVSPGSSFSTVSVSKDRLYVVTLEWDSMPINVFELRSGALLARLGGATSRY